MDTHIYKLRNLFHLYTMFLSFSETAYSVDTNLDESSGLGAVGGSMRPELGILDAADRNPVLHDFDHGLRH